MTGRDNDSPPECDRFGDAPHPRETTSLFGHGEVETLLLDELRSGRLPHAIILGGPEGIGKATLAWRLARFMLINPDYRAPAVQNATDLSAPPDHPQARQLAALAHPDVMLLRRTWPLGQKHPYTVIRVNDVRAMIARLHNQPSYTGGWRIVIVDCADDLNASSANAMLKVVEEPPPRTLFIIVAHRPGRVMPTIRSRARLVRMSPLEAPDVGRAIAALGDPWSNADPAAIAAAARRSHGSVLEALRLLDGDALKLAETVDTLLGGLPDIDWSGVHALGQQLHSREVTEDFEAVVNAIYDWMAARLHASGGPAASLAPMADLWEKFGEQVRQTNVYNLDRRPLILSIFNDLAAAVRSPAA